ncbi:MAG: NAD(P)-binding protein, partial [Candidatus Hodarchaeales archaeon]
MKNRDEFISILGAGAAGLTAAINLAKAGYEVTVFESKPSVGRRFKPNFQALFTHKDIQQYFEEVNLNVNFSVKKIHSSRFIWEGKKDIVIDWKPIEINFLLRGRGEGSLE